MYKLVLTNHNISLDNLICHMMGVLDVSMYKASALLKSTNKEIIVELQKKDAKILYNYLTLHGIDSKLIEEE